MRDIQADAIRTAVKVARGWGLRVGKPVPLRSTHNVVAWLRPSGVVAKVGVGRHQRLRTELEAALELSALGAPVVSPATELPAVVHCREGLDVTFWRYHPQPPEASIAPARMREALRALHAALARMSPSLRARLPSYMRDLDLCRAHLDSPGVPALPAADQRLLAATFDRLREELIALAPSESHVVLHGSAHGYNVLLVDDAPRFIDLETVCTGPVEWDLVHVEPEGDVQPRGSKTAARLLRACRDMTRVITAIWCWADVDRGDLRAHAELHLDHVRAVAALWGGR